MKKKIILGILVVISLFIITGCGTVSKEKMIKESHELALNTFISEWNENKNKAKDKYIGNIYKIQADVISIEDNYAKMAIYGIEEANYDNYNYMKVYFNNDDLSSLKSFTKINFVGKITNIDDSDGLVIDIKNAFYINDNIKINGYLTTTSSGDVALLCEEIGDEEIYYHLLNVKGYSTMRKVYLKDEWRDDGTTVTILGKVKYNDKDERWDINEIDKVTFK